MDAQALDRHMHVAPVDSPHDPLASHPRRALRDGGGVHKSPWFPARHQPAIGRITPINEPLADRPQPGRGSERQQPRPRQAEQIELPVVCRD
ncbi:hypothetical protein GCM10009810_15480 [Nostocoides vanveenii]|uniref:Uncharacterized protein n=1 Tax=Nostocoides vanveenii TaxID=330835 RepID=A0ABN2KI47_9MICO